MSRFPNSTPEAQGISSTAIQTFVEALEREVDSVHSFILLRHGHIIAEGWWEPYRREDPHTLFSLSKSFTSTAIGLLIAEGRLALDDLVTEFFPDELPPDINAYVRQMRVRHLLSMSTGHTSEPGVTVDLHPERSWVYGFFAHPVEHEPGTHFFYNSLATYVLSAIVTRITGERMVDYLRPRLFEPLGIQNPFWEVSPQGINTGGWGLNITTADIAALGQLYLQKGLWQGQQLLPEAWIETASSKQIDNGDNPDSDWTQGYGYQFWRCRHNLYRGDGAMGQYCVVMNDHDAVLVMTSGLGDMQQPMTLAWEHLLPAFQSAPLPAAELAHAALLDKLSQLRLVPLQDAGIAPQTGSLAARTFRMVDNPDSVQTVSFDFAPEQTVITLGKPDRTVKLIFGHGVWMRQSAVIHPRDESFRELVESRPGAWPIAASGAWTDEATFTAKLWWYETPFAWTMTCRFAGDQVTIEQCGNVGFSPTAGPTLYGVLT